MAPALTIPDLGDTHAELRYAVDMAIDNYANEDMAASLPALAAGPLPRPELMSRFREAFLLPQTREHRRRAAPRHQARRSARRSRHRHANAAKRRVWLQEHVSP
jgi:hypothetical protein